MKFLISCIITFLAFSCGSKKLDFQCPSLPLPGDDITKVLDCFRKDSAFICSFDFKYSVKERLDSINSHSVKNWGNLEETGGQPYIPIKVFHQNALPNLWLIEFNPKTMEISKIFIEIDERYFSEMDSDFNNLDLLDFVNSIKDKYNLIAMERAGQELHLRKLIDQKNKILWVGKINSFEITFSKNGSNKAARIEIS